MHRDFQILIFVYSEVEFCCIALYFLNIPHFDKRAWKSIQNEHSEDDFGCEAASLSIYLEVDLKILK